MSTKVILLGTGTPNACPQAMGPALAVVVDNQAYLVDFGPGVVRQCAKAFHQGLDALAPKKLTRAFLTHLHSDHTTGLPDLIYTPWVLERNEPLQIIGPKKTKAMCEAMQQAYQVDIDFRLHGFEKANDVGWRCEVTEIQQDGGMVYQDDLVSVEAFRVDHGTLDSFGYRFVTKDKKVIVISGDTKALPLMAQKAKDVDLLVHEVYYDAGLKTREAKWQTYHASVHTSTKELAEIAIQAHPKLVVTTHRIYHMNIQDNTQDLALELAKREDWMMQEIREIYQGPVVHGHDLDCFDL